MKLFKSLLVAPATLGLLAPLSATANEVTISDFSPAEQLAITNSRVDGLEARLNNFEAGSFSETTTASFGSTFYVGSVENSATGEATTFSYDFGMDLSTSFTGEDSLDIAVIGGDAGVTAVDGFMGGDGTSDALTLDGVAYTFPLGGGTMVIGDNTDGSVLFSKACVYGGPSDTLSDCGSPNSAFAGAGTAVGYSYDFDNGFTVAAGYAGDGSSTNGLMTDEGLDSYGLNAMYTGDTYGISLSYATVEATTTSRR